MAYWIISSATSSGHREGRRRAANSSLDLKTRARRLNGQQDHAHSIGELDSRSCRTEGWSECRSGGNSAWVFHYVGDWHTHPETHPTPSNVDVESIQETFRLSRHELAAFVLIVVGTAPAPGGLYVAISCEERIEQLDVARVSVDRESRLGTLCPMMVRPR